MPTLTTNANCLDPFQAETRGIVLVETRICTRTEERICFLDLCFSFQMFVKPSQIMTEPGNSVFWFADA